jgi:hypothetical protein
LNRYCKVVDALEGEQGLQVRKSMLIGEYGSEKFIKTYCAMCVKAVYASRFKKIKYVVVNTL